MKQKIYTVAIIGVGARGSVYGRFIAQRDKWFRIVALCDFRQDKLESFGREFQVSDESLYADETEFFKEKRADVLVIATQDKDHIRHCLKAFELGYDVLLEKPITDDIEECNQLLSAQKQYGNKALVCHVLRYAPAFLKVGELLKNGEIGRLINIEALERVGYWHQAHSYVRGNWRKREDSTPMIMAKCCHDLDLLQYYAGAACESVSSTGNLTLFKKENAPKDCADFCVNCQYKSSCSYSAVNIYVERWKEEGKPIDIWPHNVVANAPLTEEKLYQAIEKGPYGRCVYKCDNNVVDHQLVQMAFKNGVKATLTMTAFTKFGGRRMSFYGTEGSIVLDEQENTIRVEKFAGESKTLEIQVLNEGGYGHGGGDFYLIENLYRVLCGETPNSTSLESSIKSHLMAIYAEQSRLENGKLIYIHQ